MKVDPSHHAADVSHSESVAMRRTPKNPWTPRRVFTRIAVVGGLTLAIGYFAVNLALQSEGARARLLGTLQARTGMEFYFDEIRWSPIDGISVYGLKVDQSEIAMRVMPTAPPFFFAEKVRVDLFWADLLQGERRVKAVVVDDPSVFIVRGEAGKLLLPQERDHGEQIPRSIPVVPQPATPPTQAEGVPPTSAADHSPTGASPAPHSVTQTEPSPLVVSPELVVEGGSFTIYDVDHRQAVVELSGVGANLPPVVDESSSKDGSIQIESGGIAILPGLNVESELWPLEWPVSWEGSAIRGERKEFNVPGGKLFGQFVWNPRAEGVPLLVDGDLQQFNLVDAVSGPEGDFQLESCLLSGKVRFEALLSRSNSAVLTGALGAEKVVIKGGPALQRFASGVGQELLPDDPPDADGSENADEVEQELVRMALPVGIARFRWTPTSMQDQKVDFQVASSGMNVAGVAVVSRTGRVVSRATCVLTGPAMSQLDKLEQRLPRALHFGFRAVTLPTVPPEAGGPAPSADAGVTMAPAEVTAIAREFVISGTLKEPLVAVWDRGELLTFGSLVRRVSANIAEPPEPAPEVIDDDLLPMD